MIDIAQSQIVRFRSSGIVLDTNILILLLVGLIDPALIPQGRRTSKYTIDHFRLLTRLLSPVDKFLVTPHVATEADNLVNSVPSHLQDEYRAHLARYIKSAKEITTDSKKLIGTKVFKSLGLTDAAVRKLSKKKLVVTDDFPLSNFINTERGNVINFTNLWPYFR